MASPNLPTNVDSTYADDAGDESVAAHQQHHDTIHAMLNDFDAAGAPTTGNVLEWDGTVWTPGTLAASGSRPFVVVASNDMPAEVQDVADYVCTGTGDEGMIQQALVDTAPLVSRNSGMPTGAGQRGRVQLTGGEFNITNPIEMYPGTSLHGAGNLTILKATTSLATSEAIIQGTDANLIDIAYLHLNGNGGSGYGHGIHLHATLNPTWYPTSSADMQCAIHDVFFYNLQTTNGGVRHGVWLTKTGTGVGMWGTEIYNVNGKATGNGIFIDATSDCFVNNCHVHGAGTGYAGVYLDCSNARVVGTKAFYCDTGFRIAGLNDEISGCEAQDCATGWNFTGADTVASAIVADSISTDGFVIGVSNISVHGRFRGRLNSRYQTPTTNAVRFVGTPTNSQIMIGIKGETGSITNAVSGTYNGAQNFVRISAGAGITTGGSQLYSVG